MLVSGTKIDDDFPQDQFVIDGFRAPHRLDQNCLGGGLILLLREDILSNLLTIEAKPIECFYVELNLCNKKWLVKCSYNPHKNSIGTHLHTTKIQNPPCTDLTLTKVVCGFQGTCIVETGLPDFHLMTLTYVRKSFKKYQPKIINYWSYINFLNEAYWEMLTNNLSQENFINNDDSCQGCGHISVDALNKHVPCMKKACSR